MNRTDNIMKRFSINLFKSILLLLAVAIICSCNRGSGERFTINLGETPWCFTKIKQQNRVNLANPTTLIKKEDGKVLIFTLENKLSIVSLKLVFNQANINRAQYTIIGLDSQGIWKPFIVRHGNGVELKYETVANVTDTGKTVGLVNVKKFGYCFENISGNYTALKITIDKLADISANEVKLLNNTIEVYDLRVNMGVKAESQIGFDDSGWEKVGIPHCYNDNDTYLNASEMSMWRGETWYRKSWHMPQKLSNKRVVIEFQGVNIGAAVYVNGKFQPGNTAVAQPDEVTHVGGFLPFAIDITNDLKPGKNNLIAVRVSNAFDGFYTNPGFGNFEGFGMGWGGIVSPVYLHVTNQVSIPPNAYSPTEKWGTYLSILSANSDEAHFKAFINVENTSKVEKQIVVKTLIIDQNNKTVLETESEKKLVEPNKSTIFSNQGLISKPKLWFPNGSKKGTPYLYKVKHQVWDNGNKIDEYSENMGIRTITWDGDYCYVNGEKTILRGFGNRNIYPALGSAIPAELQWKDIKLIADAGGNTLRVGHVPSTKTMVEACDAYGILVIQNSGDNEWVLKNEPALTYKHEYDREMMVSFRNHPSIAVWESNNGLPFDGGDIYYAINTHNEAMKWDSLQPRIVHNRDGYPQNWTDSLRVMVGYTNRYQKVEGSPSLNTEVYGAYWDGRRSWNMARFDYENEAQFTQYYVNNYVSDISQKACGWIDWMLAETQGEAYTIYLNGMKNQKSLGSSAMDGNRFPKFKYLIYKNALWVDYETKPGVVLQSSWNLEGCQTVQAYSNCPRVELRLNGITLGTKSPDSNTKLCEWKDIKWEKGTLVAIGMDENGKELCRDSRTSSGKPYKLELTIEPNLVKPNGTSFITRANGSDVTIATVKVLDQNGNLCVNADNMLHFKVTGNAQYRGSYNFYIQKGASKNDFAPGAKTLKAEGGLMRVAIKSGFTSGRIVVEVSSKGLLSSTEGFYVNILAIN